MRTQLHDQYYDSLAGVHARWAMLAVAGILAQEIVRPDIFWQVADMSGLGNLLSTFIPDNYLIRV